MNNNLKIILSFIIITGAILLFIYFPIKSKIYHPTEGEAIPFYLLTLVVIFGVIYTNFLKEKIKKIIDEISKEIAKSFAIGIAIGIILTFVVSIVGYISGYWTKDPVSGAKLENSLQKLFISFYIAAILGPFMGILCGALLGTVKGIFKSYTLFKEKSPIEGEVLTPEEKSQREAIFTKKELIIGILLFLIFPLAGMIYLLATARIKKSTSLKILIGFILLFLLSVILDFVLNR